METIDKLESWFDKWSQELELKVENVHQQIAQELCDDVKKRAVIPTEATRNQTQFDKYVNSIKIEATKREGDSLETRVASDMVVNDGSKWDGVPIGAFLEWGTGELGYNTNSYPHGYPYTLTGPWDLFTYEQWFRTNTYGIPATPHFYPAAQAIKPKFLAKIKEIVK